MTQSPQSGPTAPRSPDYSTPGGYPGSGAPAAASHESTWGAATTTTTTGYERTAAPAASDSPTRTLPQVPPAQGNQPAGSPQTPGPPHPGPPHPGPQQPGQYGSSGNGQAHPQAPGPQGGQHQGGSADRGRPSRAARRGPRRARLQLRHVDPWTVLKFSCVLSIALFFVWLIVIGVLFGVLDGAGIIGKINDTVTTLQGGNAKAPVTAGVVFGGAAIIGVVNIVLFIALSTIGSIIYNLCADLVGGVEVTLSER